MMVMGNLSGLDFRVHGFVMCAFIGFKYFSGLKCIILMVMSVLVNLKDMVLSIMGGVDR